MAVWPTTSNIQRQRHQTKQNPTKSDQAKPSQINHNKSKGKERGHRDEKRKREEREKRERTERRDGERETDVCDAVANIASNSNNKRGEVTALRVAWVGGRRVGERGEERKSGWTMNRVHYHTEHSEWSEQQQFAYALLPTYRHPFVIVQIPLEKDRQGKENHSRLSSHPHPSVTKQQTDWGWKKGCCCNYQTKKKKKWFRRLRCQPPISHELGG